MRVAAAGILALLLVTGCSGRKEAPSGARTEAPPTFQVDAFEYLARGNEPFWSIEFSATEVVFREPGNIDGTRGDPVPVVRDGERLVFRTTFHDSASTPVQLTLEPERCVDSMSGSVFDYRAELHIGSRLLVGCGKIRPMTPLGDWTVVAHRFSGIGAISETEAAAWHGKSAHYAIGLASCDADTCHDAAYGWRVVTRDSLLAIGYHGDPAKLGLKPGGTITVFGIHCGASEWEAPGSTIFRMSDGTVYAVWDGVFFELRRASSKTKAR